VPEVDALSLTIGSALVLIAIAVGAGLVLGVVRLLEPVHVKNEPDADHFTTGEVRALLREERSTMRADFAEHVERISGVADTVKRHRKKAEAIEQAIDAREERDEPADPGDQLEARRRRAEHAAKASGQL